jgi:hypothetical protein
MKRSRSSVRTRSAVLAIALAVSSWSGAARADVVDDIYAAGNQAALAGDWAGAIEHWERALELLPGRSAQLDYDLGTVYAQIGELGRATYYLQRALQPEARPGVEVAEAARRNLGIVRHRAEVQAEVNDARISDEERWWDLVVAVLAGRTMGWLTLVSGWLLVATIMIRLAQRRRLAQPTRPAQNGRATRARQHRAGTGRITAALALVFALVFMIGGGLHGIAMKAADDHPDAIALDSLVELREGPGAHLPVTLRLQGGSRVRMLDERSGWVRVRLPAGLEGWARRESIARLDAPVMRSSVRAELPSNAASTP